MPFARQADHGHGATLRGRFSPLNDQTRTNMPKSATVRSFLKSMQMSEVVTVVTLVAVVIVVIAVTLKTAN